LAELVAAAAGGLSDRDRALLELAYRHGLDGPELGQALGVSRATANRMMSRLRETVERSLGALLVARHARRGPDGCPELGALLAGWDGKFTILMRKRVARHIESCPTCDDERRRRVTPAALLGAVPVVIPVPGWLRERTLDQIQLPATSVAATTSATTPGAGSVHENATPATQLDADGPSTGIRDAVLLGADPVRPVVFAATTDSEIRTDAPQGDDHDETSDPHSIDGRRVRRRRRLLLLVLFAALIAAAVLAMARLDSTTVVPIDVTTPAPAPTSAQPLTTTARQSPLPPAPPPRQVDVPVSSIVTAPTRPAWTSTPALITTPEPPPPPIPIATTPVTTTQPATAQVTSTPSTTPTTTTVRHHNGQQGGTNPGTHVGTNPGAFGH
jgi:hypothetical protein